MGEIELAAHQMDAVARIKAALTEFGGAFLCDAVGAGKTFVGLAIAREMRHAVIIAPAGLRTMWRAAMRSSGVDCPILSTESLSRGAPALNQCECVIVDEAHHFRNRSTRRHRALAAFVADRSVLMITATPIHNARRDLESLASLFLGAKAQHLTNAELTRLIIRREKGDIAGSVAIPRVENTLWWTCGDSPALVEAVMALPPPVPFRDSGDAARLVSLGLLRQWASSEAALAAALKRRLARAVALESSLATGEYPTAREMRSWINGDDTVQLGFPGLFAIPSKASDFDSLLRAVREHEAALRRLAALLTSSQALDDLKCEKLIEMMRSTPGARIIAFASYEATVTSFLRRLSAVGHIAAMTSRGGRIASGSIPKREIESQFSPDFRETRESERIDLLLTTDLLSEGVNLQRASAIVHLDLPWTAARMDQRVGRIARIGSRHEAVSTFGFQPPASCERILRGAAIVNSKWSIAALALGTDYDHSLNDPRDGAVRSFAQVQESLRSLLRRWRSEDGREVDAPIVGAVRANHPAFLALIEEDGEPILVACDGEISDRSDDVYRIASEACGEDAAVDPKHVESELTRLGTWLEFRQSKAVAGIGDGAFLHRRRKLIARVNSSAARLPLHQRMERESLFSRARRLAGSMHGAERERILTDPRTTIDTLAKLVDAKPLSHRVERDSHGYRVRALLLLVAPTPAPSS